MANSFDPINEATRLNAAMKNVGTNEKEIIDVLANRTVSDRKQIALSYKQAYGRDLEEDIKSELSGHFEKVVNLSFCDKAELHAKSILEATSGAGTNESALIQIICMSTNEEIKNLKEAYLKLFKNDLCDVVKSETSGDFGRILIALLQGARETGVDLDQVKADCELLYSAGEGTMGTDESEFAKIFNTRSFEQIHKINELYSKIMEHDLQTAINNETSGNMNTAMITIVRTALDKTDLIVDLLYKAMKGLGTSDDELIRLVLAYSEENLEEIKCKFLQKYNLSLVDWIKSETSGDYERYLVAVVESN